MPKISRMTRTVAALRHGRRPVLAGAALALLATIVLVAPGQADPPPVAPGPPTFATNTIKIVNQETGLCISPAGGSASLNNLLVQYYCDADQTRLWDNTLRADGFDELFNAGTDLCPSPAGGGVTAGTAIVQYYCDANPARGWALVATSDHGYRIENENSDLCMSVNAGAGVNAMLTQTSCDDPNAALDWYFSYGDYIRNVRSSMCVYSKNGGVNAPVAQTYCGAPFRLSIDSSGWYVLRDTSDSLCLSPAGGSTAANASIVEYYCDTDPARHWTLTLSNGTYAIRNVHSALCLSPAGGGTTAATPIVQYYCDGDPSRLWTLMTS